MTPPRTNGLEQLQRALDELRRSLDAGRIDQATFDTAAAAMSASLQGDGAIAQGEGAAAAGAGGAVVQGSVSGTLNLGVLIQVGTAPGAKPDDLRRAYLARVMTRANQLPLFAGDPGGHVRLSSVYTALLTEGSGTDAALLEVAAKQFPRRDRDEHPWSALDALNAESKLVLLGGPGSGKSTFVNFVALAMAGELLGAPASNLATLTAPLPRPQRWDHGPLVPVLIVLRDLASQLPPPGAPVDAEVVWNYLRESLKRAAVEGFAPILHEEMLHRGALVLLDGLDEVPDAFNRRVQVKQAVKGFADTFSRCRFLATSRTYAYQKQDWKLDGFGERHLCPFTLDQMQSFADAWYAHMVELLRLTATDAEDRVAVLKRSLKTNERIRELGERPLLLTLIAQLQTQRGGSLPERREALYDKAVEMLLNTWESMKARQQPDGGVELEPSLAEWLHASRDDIRKQLNRLAFEAHRDQPYLVGTADIGQRQLIDALLKASRNRADVKVLLLEAYLRDRAGILAAHGVEMYQFPHRSFQEYLAACHLTDDLFPDQLADLTRNDPNRWREVALLAGAKAKSGGLLGVWALAESLCPSAPADLKPDRQADPNAHWGALLAGRVLVESADLPHIAERDQGKLRRIRDWQLTIMRTGVLPATERALAGRTLAALGDPRPEVMTIEGMEFCHVPAGPFTMGGDLFEDERPTHPVILADPYFIARFPVTGAQWREYVSVSGAAPDDQRSLSGRDNNPVGFVTWHEALRFCAFLSIAWRDHLPEHFIVTLPSEAEWEKAARGGHRVPIKSAVARLPEIAERLAATGPDDIVNSLPLREYPWSDEPAVQNANIGSDVGEASAVGCYPAGASPYGTEEMSGNVWEWTRSLWGKAYGKSDFGYLYRPEDERREALEAGNDVMRVGRGGAWNCDHLDARCASRRGAGPGDRSGRLGFRVVLRSFPVRRSVLRRLWGSGSSGTHQL